MHLSDARSFAVVATIAVITIALRAVPIFALSRLSSSAYLRFLGETMPTGVMILLVAYTLRGDTFLAAPFGLPRLVPLALAVAVQWIKRDALLAIGVGLAAHMIAVNVLMS